MESWAKLEPVVSGNGAGCRQVIDESKLDLSGEVFTGTRVVVVFGSGASCGRVTDESKAILGDVFTATGEELVSGSGVVCNEVIESKRDLLGEVFTIVSGSKAGCVLVIEESKSGLSGEFFMGIWAEVVSGSGESCVLITGESELELTGEVFITRAGSDVVTSPVTVSVVKVASVESAEASSWATRVSDSKTSFETEGSGDSARFTSRRLESSASVDIVKAVVTGKASSSLGTS